MPDDVKLLDDDKVDVLESIYENIYEVLSDKDLNKGRGLSDSKEKIRYILDFSEENLGKMEVEISLQASKEYMQIPDVYQLTLRCSVRPLISEYSPKLFKEQNEFTKGWLEDATNIILTSFADEVGLRNIGDIQAGGGKPKDNSPEQGQYRTSSTVLPNGHVNAISSIYFHIDDLKNIIPHVKNRISEFEALEESPTEHKEQATRGF